MTALMPSLTGQEQTDGGLDLPGGDSATPVGKTASLVRGALKDFVHGGVRDRHVCGGNTGVRWLMSGR